MISDHGHWGIPIPIYYYKSSGKPFIKQEIIDQFQKSQSEDDLLNLPRKYRHLSSKLERKNEIFSGTFETICALMEEEEEGGRREEDRERIVEDGRSKVEEGRKLEGGRKEEGGKKEGGRKEEGKQEEDGKRENEGRKRKEEKEKEGERRDEENGRKEEVRKEEVKVSTFFMEGKEQIWPNLLGAAFLEGKLDYKKIKLHGLLKEVNPDSLVRMNKFSSIFFKF